MQLDLAEAMLVRLPIFAAPSIGADERTYRQLREAQRDVPVTDEEAVR